MNNNYVETEQCKKRYQAPDAKIDTFDCMDVLNASHSEVDPFGDQGGELPTW